MAGVAPVSPEQTQALLDTLLKIVVAGVVVVLIVFGMVVAAVRPKHRN